MSDARDFIKTFMAARGTTRLVPAREEDLDSLWVMEDKAPGAAAGYYRKVFAPLPHQWISDGRSAVLRWGDVEIRSSREPTRDENEEVVVDVLRTLQEWVDEGLIGSLDSALLPFRRQDDDVWWRILRVAPDATENELDHAYRRQALITHPDRGGTEEAFLRIRKAYEEGLARIKH